MIYTASFFQAFHHNGQLMSVARTEPQDFPINGKLLFFVPSQDTHKALRENTKTLDEIILAYRSECASKLKEIMFWLETLKPEEDITLVSWELQGEFSLRNLALKFVEKYRPDCLGGADVPTTWLFNTTQPVTPTDTDQFLKLWCEHCKYYKNNKTCFDQHLEQSKFCLDTTIDKNFACPDFL